MKYAKVLAIDGPCGSGKSTIAKMIAEKLDLMYIDTGAMFRAIGFYLHAKGINTDSQQETEQALADLKLVYHGKKEKLISVNDEDLTEKIREHHVSKLASTISKFPKVRDLLLEVQRDLAANHLCAMEGRDITTVVFPNAFLKIYLMADPKVRAKRRYDELIRRGASDIEFDTIYEDVLNRDRLDMEREVAPLKKADDAIEVDSTELEIEQVVDVIISHMQARQKELGLNL